MANPNPKSRKGIPNKLTRTVREQMTAFVESIDQKELRALWLKVKKNKPDEALKIYTRIMEYYVPKLASHQITPGDSGKPLIIERRVVIERDPKEKEE